MKVIGIAPDRLTLQKDIKKVGDGYECGKCNPVRRFPTRKAARYHAMTIHKGFYRVGG